MTITAAVDGSSLGNPGPAGWAWVVSEDCWDAGGWPSGTNNLGELNAVLELLKATAQAGLADQELHILADSQYAINVISKWSPGWKKRGWVKADKKPIKNLELIQEIDRAMQGRIVTFEWVKGHAGHPLNERADDAARSCAEAYRDGRDIPTGPGFASTESTESGAGVSATTAEASSAAGTAASTATELGAATLKADAASAGGESQGNATATEAPEVLLERQFLDAWLQADSRTLKALEAPGCIRIWHNGSLTQGLEGRAPEHVDGRETTRKQHLGCGEGGASNSHAPVLTNPVAGPSSSPKCSSCLGLSCAEQCTCPGTPVQQRRLWPYRSRSRSS